MVLPIPADIVGVVVDGIWDVACVVNTRRPRGVIRAPDHVDTPGLDIGIVQVVVEDHLEVDTIGRIGKVFRTGLRQQRLRMSDAKACTEDERKNGSRHGNLSGWTNLHGNIHCMCSGYNPCQPTVWMRPYRLNMA